jgi:hypothetical protein
MSEEQLAEIEKAQAQAKLSAEKFEKVFQATEPSNLPRGPIGPPPEARKHQKVQVKNLEQAPSYHVRETLFGKKKIAPETGKPQTLRDVIRRRYAPKQGRVVKQRTVIRESRGAPVMTGSHKLESSGRISSELNPVRAARLAQIREYIRAFQNRKELQNLEKVWRKTRATRSHDAELRP